MHWAAALAVLKAACSSYYSHMVINKPEQSAMQLTSHQEDEAPEGPIRARGLQREVTRSRRPCAGSESTNKTGSPQGCSWQIVLCWGWTLSYRQDQHITLQMFRSLSFILQMSASSEPIDDFLSLSQTSCLTSLFFLPKAAIREVFFVLHSQCSNIQTPSFGEQGS